MTVQITDCVSLDERGRCRIEALIDASGLPADEIEDLIETGVIAPADHHAQPREFRLDAIVTVRTARRLRDDFQLDRQGVALALTLLNRIDTLQSQLNAAHFMR
ncbi:chaperone modulator CbpM [Paraburkholderia sp.]|uniref:chaperone modulator CbpM n=1 Tax=Paraburkholderia sp. TaxID=1926495 RepID=UPI0023858B54|nr:chaperone modulator CbpM [Paraburkholderia sp.]MDE1182410.1 chaperone modulator CbpM [Paraburkholderia sp.]